MEHKIYAAIKVISLLYILYRIGHFLLKPETGNIWRFLTPKGAEKEKANVPVCTDAAPYSIVGRSQTAYLAEPPEPEESSQPEKPIEPVLSEDLERDDPVMEEPDITADDVEDNLEASNQPVLSEEERFMLLEESPDAGDRDFSSSGMTYEDISKTLDVIRGEKTDDAGCLDAAHILYEVRQTDLFLFLAAQAENEQVIETLINENLDNDGAPLPESVRKKKRNGIEGFDMKKYV
jgi:hypothetical protein